MSATTLDIVGIPEALQEIRDHRGPWTEEDYLGLRERHQWPRAELLDGQLLVSPASSNDHDNVAWVLCLKLRTAAPKGELAAFMTSNLRISSKRYFIPDLLVTSRTDRGTVFNDAADVVLAAEVVSPTTHKQDCVVKPKAYAAAGIPWYVRIELEDSYAPEVIAYRNDGGTYVEHARAQAGQQFHLDEPIQISFDPAELLDYW